MKLVIPHPFTPDLTDYPYHIFKARFGPVIAHVLGHIGPTQYSPSVQDSDVASLITKALSRSICDDLVPITASPIIPMEQGMGAITMEQAAPGDILTNGADVLHYDRYTDIVDPRTEFTRVGTSPVPYSSLDPSFNGSRIEVRTLSEVYDKLGAGYIQWAEHHGIPLQTATLLAVQAYNATFVVPRSPSNPWKGLAPAARDLMDHGMNPHIATALGVTDAEFDPEDATLSLYVSMEERQRGRKTRMKTGKALRKTGISTDDEQIKRLTSEIRGALTPPEFHIGFTKADFDEAYTNGPNSCMTYTNDQYHLIRWMINQGIVGAENLRPTDALVNGDIGVAYMKSGDKITSRTLVVHSAGAWVRTYIADYATRKNGGEALKRHLDDAGYTENKRALNGQHLVKIEVPNWQEDNHLKEMFDLNNSFILGEARRVGATMDEAFERELRERADMRGYLMPYIDWNNPPVIDEGDTLRVATQQEADLIGGSMPANAISMARENSRARDVGRFGQCHYQNGGGIIIDAAAVCNWLDELYTANRTQPQPQAPQPPEATNADESPLNGETVGQWLSRLVREQQEQPVRAQEAPPTVEPVAAYGGRQRLDDILNDRDPDEDREDESHYQPLLIINGTMANEAINEAEAEELYGEAVTWLDVPSEPGLMVWAPVSHIHETDDEECDYVPDFEALFEVVNCPGYGPFREENTVVLDNGENCPRDHARYSEREQEWFDEDDVIWSEPCNDWIRESDAVRDVTGEWIPDDEAYRLPNGDYVHEDDLQRA